MIEKNHLKKVMMVGALVTSMINAYLKHESTAEKLPTITIWVHGTKRLPGIAPVSFIKRFFHCDPGLHLAQTLDEKYHHHTIAKTLIQAGPTHFAQEHFYLFGWSGKLSVKARQQAAQQLNESITTLLKNYQDQHGCTPQLRIITHSHGGNVVLHMAHEKPKDFVIDELILLACPVQKKTAHLLASPLFKKIYSLYSIVDMIQVADPQGLYHEEANCPIFSQRTFAPQNNLVQKDIRIKKRPIMHVEFMLPHFLKLLPEILEETEKKST